MEYAGFIIENFKGIKKLEIKLDSKPTSRVFTLLGLNESGKTSILEAISFFQEALNKEEIQRYIPKSEKYNFSSSISVDARLLLSEEDNEMISNYIKTLGYKSIKPISYVTVEKRYTFINSNFEKYNIYWGIDLILEKKKYRKEIILEPKDDHWHEIINYITKNLIPKIIYYPNFLFDFPERIYLNEEEGESVENVRYRDIIQDILTSINPKLTIKEQILNRLETGSNKEALEHTLGMLSAKISKTVFSAWERLFYSGSKQIEIIAGEETKPSTHPARHFLEFKLKEGPNKFMINERSLGFKWFFSFLLFTEFRKNRISDSGKILFLLDEPASNLHSTAQKKLLETFKDLVDKSMLVYTTHSHHLINPEWLSGAFIVRNKALNYESEFLYDPNQTDIEALPYKQFIAQNSNQQDYFQPILDVLEFQPGLLEKVPFIVITEGKNDYYTIKYICKMYFPKIYDNINFYPGTGADNNRSIISLYIAWNRPFIVLLDGDKAGIDAQKKYTQQFGIEAESIVYTLNDISKDFKGISMEGLFTETERLNITKKFDESSTVYNKGKFNTSIQNMLFLNERTDLSSKTLEQFKMLLDFCFLRSS